MIKQLHFRRNKTRVTFQIGTGTDFVYMYTRETEIWEGVFFFSL